MRHRRFACRRRQCGVAAKALAPTIPTTKPFGPRLHALAIDHKSFRALSYERLRGLFRGAFGLAVSKDARFKIEAQKAQAILRAARVVASAGTGVRIEGTTAGHWVFHCKGAVVHEPDYSRAAPVATEVRNGHVPKVWISDRSSAQQLRDQPHQTEVIIDFAVSTLSRKK